MSWQQHGITGHTRAHALNKTEEIHGMAHADCVTSVDKRYTTPTTEPSYDCSKKSERNQPQRVEVNRSTAIDKSHFEHGFACAA